MEIIIKKTLLLATLVTIPLFGMHYSKKSVLMPRSLHRAKIILNHLKSINPIENQTNSIKEKHFENLPFALREFFFISKVI